MQKIILYGRRTPWFDGIEIQPDGSVDSILSGIKKIQIKKDQDINWFNFLHSELPKIASPEEIFEMESVGSRDSLDIYFRYIPVLWERLENECNSISSAEKDFFTLYCELCWQDIYQGALSPALIPNVYVNWIFLEEKRARSQKPFIVDFAFKSSIFGTDNIVIVEIDGQSHYATYNKSQGTYKISEDIYAQHLKKDRWLRKQGFQVFRIGNSEIRDIQSLSGNDRIINAYYFFNETFGNIVNIDWIDQRNLWP